MSRSGTPTRELCWPGILLHRMENGDLLFELQETRRPLLDRMAPGAYKTIDQIYKALANRQPLDPDMINEVNRPFLTAYCKQFRLISAVIDQELQTRQACQMAIKLLCQGNFQLKIHFVLDGLFGLRDITNSEYKGYTSAELRTVIRQGLAQDISDKIIFWHRGANISFTDLCELVGNPHSIVRAANSPHTKRPLPVTRTALSADRKAKITKLRPRTLFLSDSDRATVESAAETNTQAAATENNPASLPGLLTKPSTKRQPVARRLFSCT